MQEGEGGGRILENFFLLGFFPLSLSFSSSSFISSFRPIVAFEEIVRGKGVANIFSGIYVSWKTAVSFRRERVDAIFPFIEFCGCVYVCVCFRKRILRIFSFSFSSAIVCAMHLCYFTCA